MTDLSQIVGVVVEKQKIMGGDGFTVSYMYIPWPQQTLLAGVMLLV